MAYDGTFLAAIGLSTHDSRLHDGMPDQGVRTAGIAAYRIVNRSVGTADIWPEVTGEVYRKPHLRIR